MTYADFLKSKRIEFGSVGFVAGPMNANLKPFQRLVVERSCKFGRSAIFADCGLGKTIEELEFADQVVRRTTKPVLILAPLGVVKQFEREAEKFGYPGVKACRDRSEIGEATIVVANYERLHHFDPGQFGGIVIDESSCLKSYEGKTRKQITEFASQIHYRLAATATPAPNDLIELTNHAEFLGVMTGKEIIACFFTQDGNTTQKYRLKKHAEASFWHWMATWTTALRKPSDLGFSDDGYELPELLIHEHIIKSKPIDGYLIVTEANGLAERQKARRMSLPERCQVAADIVAREPNESWLIWCDLNDEADLLRKLIPGSVECRGTEKDDVKEAKLLGFANDQIKIMITKASIAGWGLNYQHSARTIFVGLSDSFESQYQAIRRQWRFGQTRPVHVHLIASEIEGSVLANLRRKQRQVDAMYDSLVLHMSALIRQTSRDVAPYDPQTPMRLPHWLRSESAA